MQHRHVESRGRLQRFVEEPNHLDWLAPCVARAQHAGVPVQRARNERRPTETAFEFERRLELALGLLELAEDGVELPERAIGGAFERGPKTGDRRFKAAL